MRSIIRGTPATYTYTRVNKLNHSGVCDVQSQQLEQLTGIQPENNDCPTLGFKPMTLRLVSFCLLYNLLVPIGRDASSSARQRSTRQNNIKGVNSSKDGLVKRSSCQMNTEVVNSPKIALLCGLDQNDDRLG